MSQKRYLQIKNLDEYQHYKDRNPIWIKLHCAILDNYEFSHLPDETKFQAIGLMILAARLSNKLPDDERWLRQKINANTEINLKLLLEIGFLEVVKNSRNRNKNDLSEPLEIDKDSFNDCKSKKTKDESASTEQDRTEEKRKEENRKEHNTTEHTPGECADAQNAAVVCVSSENFSKTESANQFENNLLKGNFKGNLSGVEKRSQFSLEECLKYVEVCLSKGEDVKNAKGLANHLFKTGEADAFIRHALYPEKQTEIDRQIYGEPRRFSDAPCSICFGAKMADADGKGYRKCEHCRNERGKSTGLEPI